MLQVHNGVVDMWVFVGVQLLTFWSSSNQRTITMYRAPNTYDIEAIEHRARQLRAEWLRALLTRKPR